MPRIDNKGGQDEVWGIFERSKGLKNHYNLDNKALCGRDCWPEQLRKSVQSTTCKDCLRLYTLFYSQVKKERGEDGD